MTASIRFDNVTLSYQRRPALHHVSGAFVMGAANAIVGPNGAGKSTLLKALVGVLRPESGAIHMTGIAPSDIAYLPQASEIDRTQPVSVLDLVLTGLWQKLGAFAAMNAETVERARAALARVGLHGYEKHAISDLSGGQFQRVLFARILLQDAKLILLDEPFNSIDQHTTDDLIALMTMWPQEHRTVIAVLHDAALVQQCFSETLLLAREVIAWGRTADVMTAEAWVQALQRVGHWTPNPPVCHVDDGVHSR